MNKFDIKHYIKIFEKAIPTNLSNNLLDSIEDNKDKQIQHQFGNYNGVLTKMDNPCMYSNLDIFEEKDYTDLQNIIWKCIKNYLNEFGDNYFTDWYGFTPLEFHHFSVGSKMKKHCDHIYTIFDGERRGIPILTVVGLLNDDFENGQFTFFDDYDAPIKERDIMIFPSNFMYVHEIKEVTKGTRHSFVSWVW